MKPREKHHLDGQRVYRFVRAERIAHWLNAAAFLILLATGASMLLRVQIGLSPQSVRLLHRCHVFFGLVYFSGPAAILLLGNPHVAFEWLHEAFRWTRDEFLWLMGPLRRVFDPSGVPLRVGRFNAGQRMNVLIQIVAKWSMTTTGLVMHFGAGQLLMFTLHLLLCFFLVAVVTGHLYMALINPSTRPALSAMFSGYVEAEWLKRHHPGWFEELARKETASQPPPRLPEAHPESVESLSPEDHA